MAVDDGNGRPWRGGMPGLTYDAESMVSFKNRVDKLLIELGDSPAAPQKMGADKMSRTHFGGGGGAWAEAAGLFTSYDTVVKQLKQLSQLMADCLEGMGIAVVSAKNGYDGTDGDVRQRMLAIQHNTQRHYDADRDPTADGQTPAEGAPKTPPGDGAGSGGLQ
ncbi:hypothetical protein I3F58_13280 [Streptomyces sp. MUM 203J]|uniref:hypothetical protein n=1 Tax=Streptomyces sp. MUM 203J TaxID=2791990 RepID=UPI001F04DF60|nr:hypothetical protein [Streptomyces sp. MUM 203J]MCH0540527.1 hypothetical protein [Streptomyces sp. MUM 203J]